MRRCTSCGGRIWPWQRYGFDYVLTNQRWGDPRYWHATARCRP